MWFPGAVSGGPSSSRATIRAIGGQTVDTTRAPDDGQRETATGTTGVPYDVAAVAAMADRVTAAVEAVVVGQRASIRMAVVALLCEGHVLLDDVPGVGKTTMARTLARAIGGVFRRIQFTADLLPSDVSGIAFFDQKLGDFRFRPGPVFANVVLADEINRATPRTQSALLEAMQERTVTVEGEMLDLPRPFLLIATQNPIEQEGTFPLPEAQIDRFLLRVTLGYPSHADEDAMLTRFRHGAEGAAGSGRAEVVPVIDPGELSAAIGATRRVEVAPDILHYVSGLARATRTHAAVDLGASPRASLALLHAAQAVAAMAGRDVVLPDDVQAVAGPVLAHRLVLSPGSRLRDLSAERVLADVVRDVPVPVEDDAPPRTAGAISGQTG